MKRLSEKLSVIQDNLEHLSMTVKEIKTGLNELVSNHTMLRKKLEGSIMNIWSNINTLNNTIISLSYLVDLLIKNRLLSRDNSIMLSTA